jgi:Flp pilus assembly protein TadG
MAVDHAQASVCVHRRGDALINVSKKIKPSFKPGIKKATLDPLLF